MNSSISNTGNLPKPNQVPAAISDLAEALASLIDEVNMLESRLSSVLHPTGPKDGDSAGHPILVPLAESLQTSVELTREVRDRVNSMRARLEL